MTKLYIFLLPFLGLSFNIQAQKTISPKRLKYLQQIMTAYETQAGFSGQVLVGYQRKVIYQSCHGWANLGHRLKNQPKTRFRLASVSKQFTAVALLVLEKQGKVAFDQPIAKYLDQLNPALGNKITIHHLLSHSSGLARDIEELTTKNIAQSYIALSDIVQLINQSKLQFAPGERWAYSNLGYALAAAIIEKVTQKKFGAAMQELIFEPAGLKNTGHEEAIAVISNQAEGYVNLPEGIIKASFENKSYVIGAGSIYSTAEDLYRWSQVLLKGNLVRPEQVKKLFTKQKGRYSYGWFVSQYGWRENDKTILGANIYHDGGSPGFECKLSILKEHDLVVIILSNQLPAPVNAIGNKITNTLLGYEESLPKSDNTQALFQTLFTKGVNQAIALIKGWRENKETYRIPSSSKIFMIARGYLESHQYQKAILTFDFLIAKSPKWSSPYLFKAITLEESGDLQAAKTIYEQTLKINPKVSYAKNKLASFKNK